MDLRGKPIHVWTTVGKGTMKNNWDKGNARTLKRLVPKQKRVMNNTTNGMAGRTADGLEPNIPYALITIKRRSSNPPGQFVLIRVAAISFLLSHIRYAEIRGIKGA
jgi:hypothetical protein